MPSAASRASRFVCSLLLLLGTFATGAFSFSPASGHPAAASAPVSGAAPAKRTRPGETIASDLRKLARLAVAEQRLASATPPAGGEGGDPALAGHFEPLFLSFPHGVDRHEPGAPPGAARRTACARDPPLAV